MVFVEFLEFIARVSLYAFQGTEYEGLPLHLKIDTTMDNFANIVEMKKAEFHDHPDYYHE